MRPYTDRTMRTTQFGASSSARESGMKSSTSHTASGAMKRVTSTFVSGRYICLTRGASKAGATWKLPPRPASSSAPKIVGESMRG